MTLFLEWLLELDYEKMLAYYLYDDDEITKRTGYDTALLVISKYIEYLPSAPFFSSSLVSVLVGA